MGSAQPLLYKLRHRCDNFSDVGVRTIHVPIINTDLDGPVMVSITKRTDAESKGLPHGMKVPLDDFCSVDHSPLSVLIGSAEGQEGITFAETKEIFGCQILGRQSEGENLSV